MSKVKLLQIIVVVLILINISILGYWFYKSRQIKTRHHERKKVENVIANRLQLTEEQILIYNNLQNVHRSSVAPLRREIYQLRKEILDKLKEDQVDEEQIYAIASKIGEKQKEIEMLRVYHFQEIKDLLTEEQLQYFDEFIDDIAQFVNRTGRKFHQRRNIQ